MGMNVCGIEILAAARKLAQKMETANFQGEPWMAVAIPQSTRSF